ncbi:MAG: 23S rRNA (pseudouridine(1915)-N(3))-methyltransferase RlmH [Rickettsiales bacterium]
MKIICFGKQKTSSYNDLLLEFYKRVGNELEVIELSHKNGNKNEIIKREEELLGNYLKKQNINIFLDSRGKEFSSENFAYQLTELQLQNKPLIFFIGGAYGFSANFLAKADLILSLGKMTMPHMLARLILIEQIYRAKMIAHNHPYHK